MRVLVAPDAFKGTLTAAQVAAAVARGLEAGGVGAECCPVADGGEGTLAVLLPGLGGQTAGARVRGPLGAPVDAGFALVEGGTCAVVELAAASGLHLVGEPTPATAWEASTDGTGELIVAAVRAGAAVVLVAAGGSATTDGGAGALAAIEAAGGLRGARLVVLADVTVPWERCAAVFGPQKGADAATIARLAARLDALAPTLPRDPRGVPGTGAAGGLAGGLWAAHHAVIEPGAAWVLDTLELDARLEGAAALVVGEGRLDAQSLKGKVVGELVARAAAAGVPCHAIVGSVEQDVPRGPMRGPSPRFGPLAAFPGLASVRSAGTPDELEAAGAALAAELLEG